MSGTNDQYQGLYITGLRKRHNFAFEHFEIAAHTSLLLLADMANHQPARWALRTSRSGHLGTPG